MNFKKIIIGVAVVALLIVGWKMLTRVNRNDPVAVATAFTKALKKQDTSSAASYYVPDKAIAWHTSADETLRKMRSGTMDRFIEGIPSSPDYTLPANATANAMTVQSADKSFSLDMARSDGKWYVAKSPLN